MDVLVITWNYPPRRGGIENLLENLCGGLREKRRVLVVTSFAKTPHSFEPDIFRAPLPGLIFFAFFALWRGAMILACDRQVRVVFGGSAIVTPVVLILSRMFKRRAVVQIHGLDVVYRSRIYQWLCVRWLKFCDRVVANSHYTAGLAGSKAVSQERLTVIPPGVQPERFSIPTDVVVTRRRWNIDGKKILLFVGRLAKRKGIKEFIEIPLVEIVREIPEAVFLIVGDNPTESLAHRDNVVREINLVVSKIGLEKHVRLLGALSDDEVTKLYQVCDVAVLPGLDMRDDVEGFGIVALEAAAAGKPVVAMRVGGIPDAVEDGRSGILIEPQEYEAFSQAVISLLQDRDQSQSLGLYARSRVAKAFSWRHVVAQYEYVFDRRTPGPD